LRRIHSTVLLRDLRCSGLHHGGCQSNCHIRWHESWLRRPSPTGTNGPQDAPAPAVPHPAFAMLLDWSQSTLGGTYRCQATELCAGSTPLPRWNPTHWIRDLVTGNVRTGPWLRGACLAAFNFVQGVRRGVPSRSCRPGPPAPRRISN
jgi:hypothetical protein